MKAAGVDVEIMAETGMMGYPPRRAWPFVFSFRNFPSCKMLTDIIHSRGIFMDGNENRCPSSLAAGQMFEPPPTDELRIIRILDPRRYFLGPA